jgi:prepilin-type N-terminal cleavage/methylation domain-containing protein
MTVLQRIAAALHSSRSRQSASRGFTLAELLISLAILGIIATFTIPKILNSSANGKNSAVAKEAASMISGAFSIYGLNNTVASGTTAGVLTQYMNYVSVDTGSSAYGFTELCSASLCLGLHNGGVLQMISGNTFGGTATTNAIYFNLDPDGAGSAGAVTFVQYYNGRLTTYGQRATGTATTGSSPITAITTDPSYITNWQ